MVHHEILLHAFHRRNLKEFFYVDLPNLDISDWLAFLIDSVEIKWVGHMNSIFLREIQVFYYGVYAIFLSPIDEINKHGFNILENKLASPAKPQEVTVVELLKRVQIILSD